VHLRRFSQVGRWQSATIPRGETRKRKRADEKSQSLKLRNLKLRKLAKRFSDEQWAEMERASIAANAPYTRTADRLYYNRGINKPSAMILSHKGKGKRKRKP